MSEPRSRARMLADPRAVAVEDVAHDACAARDRQELGAEADEAAGGHAVVHAHAGVAVHQVQQLALAAREQLGDRAEVLRWHVGGELLERLVQLAVDHLGDDLGLADGHLEALAAHRLHEHGQRELAAALHLPGVGALGRQHAQRDVADELGVEAALDLARGELVARVGVATHQRRGVDADRQRDGGLVDVDARQRDGVLGIGEGVADGDLGDACDRDEIAGHGARRLGTRSSATVRSSSVILTRVILPSAWHQATCWPRRITPGAHAAERDAAEVGWWRRGW